MDDSSGRRLTVRGRLAGGGRDDSPGRGERRRPGGGRDRGSFCSPEGGPEVRDVPAAQGAKRQIDGDVQHMPGDRPRLHVWRLLPPLRAEVVQCLCRHTWVQGRRAGWPTTRGWECDGILGSGYFSPLGSGVFGFMGTVLGAGQVGVTGFFLGAGACRGACISASKGGRDVLVSAVVGRALHGVGIRRRRPTRGAAGSQCHGRSASCAARLSNIGPPLIFRCGLAFGSWPAWHRRCRSHISPHRSTIMAYLGSNKVAVGQHFGSSKAIVHEQRGRHSAAPREHQGASDSVQ